jgi:hypothetical protein
MEPVLKGRIRSDAGWFGTVSGTAVSSSVCAAAPDRSVLAGSSIADGATVHLAGNCA